MRMSTRNLYKCKQAIYCVYVRPCRVVVACLFVNPLVYTAFYSCLFTSLSPYFYYTDVVAMFLFIDFFIILGAPFPFS